MTSHVTRSIGALCVGGVFTTFAIGANRPARERSSRTCVAGQASLERAWSFRDPGLAIMKRDPFLRPIRSDPRFASFLKRMNFPA